MARINACREQLGMPAGLTDEQVQKFIDAEEPARQRTERIKVVSEEISETVKNIRWLRQEAELRSDTLHPYFSIDIWPNPESSKTLEYTLDDGDLRIRVTDLNASPDDLAAKTVRIIEDGQGSLNWLSSIPQEEWTTYYRGLLEIENLRTVRDPKTVSDILGPEYDRLWHADGYFSLSYDPFTDPIYNCFPTEPPHENVQKFLKCDLYIRGEENLLKLLDLAQTFKGEGGAKLLHEITSTEDTRERHLKIIDAFQHLVDNLPGLPPRDQKVVVSSIAMFAWECDSYRFGYFSELEFLSSIKEELEDFHPAEFMQAARDKVAYSGWVDLGRFDMTIELSAQKFLKDDSKRLIGRGAPTLDELPSDTVAFLEEKRPGALAGLKERLSHQTDEIVNAVRSSTLDTKTLEKEPGLIVDLPQGIVEYDVGHELTEGQKKAVYSSSDFRREDLSDWQRSRGDTPRRPTVESRCSHLAKLTRLQVSDIEPLNSISEETWFQHYLRRYEQADILRSVHQLSRVGRYSPTRAPES